VTVRTDVHGGPGRPPVEHHPATNALAAGIFAVFGVLVAAVGVLKAVYWRMYRRRMDDWQVEWMSAEPVWSGRRRQTD
jgi:DNA-binding IclR family transcriptional regulator